MSVATVLLMRESRLVDPRGFRDFPRSRARRRVVERPRSRLNRFRRRPIRWEKKPANDQALIHLACAWIAYRAADLPG